MSRVMAMLDALRAPTAVGSVPVTLARSREALVPVLLAAVALVYAVTAIEPFPVGVFQDDGVYVLLAKSLATGEGYRYLHLPGEPNATHYPPLYPAFLALLWKVWPVFPQNVVLFKFANAALTALATAMAFRFARDRVALGPAVAAATAVAFTACAPVILLTVMVLSEPMFLVALLGGLFLCERAAENGQTRAALAAGVAGGLLALIRTIGVVVVPATVLVLAWRRRWRAAAIVAVTAAAVLLPWQWWVGAHADALPSVLLGKYGPYGTWLADAVRAEGPAWVARLAWFNLAQITAQGWATVTVERMLGLRWLATSVLVLLFGIGWVRFVRRVPVAGWTVAAYLGITVAWPFMPARFTWGIWPLVGCIFVLGGQAVVTWRPPRVMRPVRWVAVAAVVLLAAGYARYNYLGTSRGWWTQVQALTADRTRPFAEWVLANTTDDEVVATDDDLIVHLYTGRRAVPVSSFTPQEHLVRQTRELTTRNLREILRLYDVRYVFAASDYGWSAVRGLAEASPPELRLVRPLPTGAVFAPTGQP